MGGAVGGGGDEGEWSGSRNYDKGEIPGSGRSTYGYILTYPRLLKVKGEHWSALGSQQKEP